MQTITRGCHIHPSLAKNTMSTHAEQARVFKHSQKLSMLRIPAEKNQPFFIISFDKDYNLQLHLDDEAICYELPDVVLSMEYTLMAFMISCQATLVKWPVPHNLPILSTIKRANIFNKPLIAICEPSQENYASAMAAGFDALVHSPSRVGTISMVNDIFYKLRNIPASEPTAPKPAPITKLSRVKPNKEGDYIYGDLKLDLNRHLFFAGEEIVHLTLAEFEIMKLLMKNPGVVLEYNHFLDSCRDINFDPSSNTVTVHICNIKRKLKNKGMQNYIINVYGVGYCLEIPAK